MAGENKKSAFSTIMDFFRKWYPIPSGILIGAGIQYFQIILISSFFWLGDLSPYRMHIALSSIIILIGWMMAFASPGNNRMAFELKSLGLGFVALGLIILIGTYWTPSSEFEDFNSAFCLAGIFLVFVVPLSYTTFWCGIVMDSLPEFKRTKYYIYAAIPLIFPILLFIFAIVFYNFSLILICSMYGFHSMIIGYLIFRRRKRAEKENEFDPKLVAETKERLILEKLDETGFKG